MVFICFTTSVVHLELVTDYSSQVLLRHIEDSPDAKVCANLSSDCGTSFMGADAELCRLFSDSSHEMITIADHLASSGTEWRFNPPSAPHFGGKWEVAVKSIKYHLRLCALFRSRP